MIYSVTDGTILTRKKLFQSAARQDATFFACFPFFFQSISENAIVNSHQTLIQYFYIALMYFFGLFVQSY